MRIEDFFSLLWSAVFVALLWYFFLIMAYGEQTGDAEANRVFYSLITGVYIIYGSVFFERRFGTWALFLTAFSVGILSALYFGENGIMNGTRPVQNLLFGGLIAVFSTVTVGGVVTATIGYFSWISSFEQARIQKEKNQQAQNDFEAEFNQFSDDGFDFDEAEFSNSGSSNEKTSSRSHAKSSPRGFDDRHPDDAIFWAVVDSPNSADAERMKAMKTIFKKEKSRAGKTGREVVLRNKKP